MTNTKEFDAGLEEAARIVESIECIAFSEIADAQNLILQSAADLIRQRKTQEGRSDVR